MLSFHIKFVQTDRQTDNGQTICSPNLSKRGHKKENIYCSHFILFKVAL